MGFLAGMENPDSILKHLADHMKPMLINSLKERRKKIFTENADGMRRLIDDLQKKLDEVETTYSFIFHLTSVFPVFLILEMFIITTSTRHDSILCPYFYLIFFWQSFLNMQLYEKALELFEDDQSTSVSTFSPFCKLFLLLKEACVTVSFLLALGCFT